MSDGWTVIPPWLYQNDLSDLELQEVYVAQAEKKWKECLHDVQVLERDQRELEADLRQARAVEAQAKQFLEDAKAALAKYRGQHAPPAPRRRALLRPRADG